MGLGRQEVIKETKTYEAGSAIEDRRFVSIDVNGRVNHTGDGLETKGVSMEAVAVTGQGVSVALQNAGNIVRVEAAGAVTRGGQVASAANGFVKDSASGDFEMGQADEGATAINQFAIINLTRGRTTP